MVLPQKQLAYNRGCCFNLLEIYPMGLPNCYRVFSSKEKDHYDGDWGKCTFNYRNQVSLWNFLSYLCCFALWFVINEYARLFMKEHLPDLLFGIMYIVCLIVSIGLCMGLNSWFSGVMSDHVHMKVKRNKRLREYLNQQE